MSTEKSSRLGLSADKPDAIEEIEYQEVKVPQGDQTANGHTGEKPASKKKYAKPHPGRYTIPEELPRVERHLYPQGYELSWNRELPQERTERLSLKIELFVEVLVRHKFGRQLDTIAIAPYPQNDPFFRHQLYHRIGSRYACTTFWHAFDPLSVPSAVSYSLWQLLYIGHRQYA